MDASGKPRDVKTHNKKRLTSQVEQSKLLANPGWHMSILTRH